MKFAIALAEFQTKLRQEYGPTAEEAIVKIGVNHDFYKTIIIESHNLQKSTGQEIISMDLCGLNNPKIFGVSICPRQKDDF